MYVLSNFFLMPSDSVQIKQNQQIMCHEPYPNVLNTLTIFHLFSHGTERGKN